MKHTERPHPEEQAIARAAPLAPPAALYDRLRDELRSAAPEVVPSRRSVRANVAAAALAGAVALPGILVVRSLIDHRPVVRADAGMALSEGAGWRLGILVVLATLATLAFLRGGRAGLGLPRRLLVLALAAPVFAYAALSILDPLHCPATDVAATGLSPLGLPCALVATAVGSLELALLVFLKRRTVPVAFELRGALAGAAAGLWAGVALFVHCPGFEATHVVVGHVVPVLAFVGIGAALASSRLRA